MSSTDRSPALTRSADGAAPTAGPTFEPVPARSVELGEGMAVRRILPGGRRRMVGPWCLVDHFGPLPVARGPGMRVPPHPHTGIRTVTWLVEGAVVHRDSLGSEQRIVPGQLNVMTAAAGVAHSEESPADRPAVLHGVQLWAAMAGPGRDGGPAFDHYPELPASVDGASEVSVLLGEHAGTTSAAGDIGPAVALGVRMSEPAAVTSLTLDPGFEHGALVLEGEVTVDGVSLGVGSMLYLGRGRPGLALACRGPSRVLVLGGAPFDEPIVMWWNLVARSDEEIRAACDDWTAGRRFGEVAGFDGDRLDAPALPAGRLRPR